MNAKITIRTIDRLVAFAQNPLPSNRLNLGNPGQPRLSECQDGDVMERRGFKVGREI